MDKKYGIYGIFADLTPTPRQQLFEEVKNKAVKCTDRTQLFAAIYPWVLHLAREYAGKDYNILQWQRAADSFKADLYDFQQALSMYLSGISFVVSSDSSPADLKRIRDEALDSAIEMAVRVAEIELSQCGINLSVVMARFVEDL